MEANGARRQGRGLADIFISYAREDAGAVRRLAESLREAGYDVWWDRKLGGGAIYADEIERELKSAGVVIVAWSAAAVQSHWVIDEATEGREAGKLAPVTLDGTPPPLGFRQYHTIDLSTDESAAVARLIEAVEKLCAAGWALRTASPPPAASARASAPKAIKERLSPWRRLTAALRQRRALAAASGVAAIAALVVALSIQRSPPVEAVRALSSPPVSAPEPSADAAPIAVLPVRVSDDRVDAALATRLSRDLEAALTREPWLSVAASRFVESAVARTEDVRAIATDLKVDYLVDGELRVDDSMTRATIRLFAAETGASVWTLTKSFSTDAMDAPDFAAELANAIWRNVYVAEARRRKSAPRGGFTSREFIALALGGVRHAPWTEGGVREAIAVLDEAAAAYPQNADVLAARAQAQMTLALIDPTQAAGLRESAESLMAQAFALDPQSRWVEYAAADMNFSIGRYYAAAQGYERLIARGYALPATRARAADARARLSGGFAAAAALAEAESARAFTPLQESQTRAAAAYLNAAAGNDAAALVHARAAVAAFPNNPDAVMALVIVSILTGPEAGLTDSARAFCNFYPSFAFPEPANVAGVRQQLEGDGGADWRAFVARVIDAYERRWSQIAAACS